MIAETSGKETGVGVSLGDIWKQNRPRKQIMEEMLIIQPGAIKNSFPWGQLWFFLKWSGWGATTYPAKKESQRNKYMKVSGRIYLPHEWAIGLTWGHAWKKENSINPKGKLWVRETCASHFPPESLAVQKRETTQFHLRSVLVRNFTSHHLAVEGHLLKEMGHV